LFHRVVSDVSLLTIIKTHIACHLRFQHRCVWMQLEVQTRYGSFVFPIHTSHYSSGQCSIIVACPTIPALAGIPTQSLPLLPCFLTKQAPSPDRICQLWVDAIDYFRNPGAAPSSLPVPDPRRGTVSPDTASVSFLPHTPRSPRHRPSAQYRDRGSNAGGAHDTKVAICKHPMTA
jgi:hypothetical protein